MIHISDKIFIDEKELHWDFVRSSGPGGQNVNKVATAVQLRFDVAHAEGLPPEVRRRAIKLAGKRVTSDGVLIINARRFRTQERNRSDALERLIGMIRAASYKQRARIKTKPTTASRIKRVQEKRHKSTIKEKRRSIQTNQD
jgi:ribosome-associated protein